MIALGRAYRLVRWLYNHRRPDQTHVFECSRNAPWERCSLNRQVRSFANIAGIRREVSSYCCRHAFTVRGLKCGIGDRQLADLLGHETTNYIRWYGSEARNDAGYLNDLAARIGGKKCESKPDNKTNGSATGAGDR
jgi:site-specific recombinase XerD